MHQFLQGFLLSLIFDDTPPLDLIGICLDVSKQ